MTIDARRLAPGEYQQARAELMRQDAADRRQRHEAAELARLRGRHSDLANAIPKEGEDA